MKKLLVASTALVAFAAVSSAQAADPIKLSVGGFQEAWVGFVNQDDDGQEKYADVLVQTDTEIRFSGSTKLDNGLTVGAIMDLMLDRGDTGAAAGADDSFMYISSDTLGRVNLGGTKAGSYGLAHKSPDVGIGHNDGDIGNWVNQPAAVTVVANDTMATEEANDGHKVVYITPNFSGVQAAFTYGLGTNGVNGTEVNKGATGNDTILDAAIAYNGDLGGVSVGADVAWQQVNPTGTQGTSASNEVSVRGGLSIGVAGFTLGGSYIETNNVAGVKAVDSDVWDLGVSYATGPYAVSVSYLNAKQDESAATNSLQDERSSWMLSGSYDLGAGVALKGSVFSVEYDDASTNAGNSINDNEGFGVVAGLAVSF